MADKSDQAGKEEVTIKEVLVEEEDGTRINAGKIITTTTPDGVKVVESDWAKKTKKKPPV